jgi:hypothetical protein
MRIRAIFFLPAFLLLGGCGNPLGGKSTGTVDANFHPGVVPDPSPPLVVPRPTLPSEGMRVGVGGTVLSSGATVSASANVPSMKIRADGAQIGAVLSVTN